MLFVCTVTRSPAEKNLENPLHYVITYAKCSKMGLTPAVLAASGGAGVVSYQTFH